MVDFPQNALTQIIEAARSANLSGEYRRPVGAVAGPQPTVRSSSLGTEAPLTDEERAELDMKAIQLGIRDPRLGNADDFDTGTYASEEDTKAALEQEPVKMSAPTGRMTARELAPPSGLPKGVFIQRTPTLPDFKAVERIDFTDNTIRVGGMAFPLPVEMAAELRRRVIQTVAAEVQARLDLALDALRAEVSVATDAGAPGNTEAGA